MNSRISTNKILPYATKFKRILIKDSLCFQIDKSLADHYPGSGGSGSKAAIRIRFEYDVLGGIINDLDIHAFNDQDATDATATMELMQEGDLVIRDLDYMHLEALGQYIENGASFLSRLNTQTKAYQVDKEEFAEIKFGLIVKRMRELGINRIAEDVYIDKDKFPVRLFLYLLPQEEYARRISKAQKETKKKGRMLSKDFKAKAALNLFITNVIDDSLTDGNAWSLYQLRWQVELIFKIWKSICVGAFLPGVL